MKLFIQHPLALFFALFLPLSGLAVYSLVSARQEAFQAYKRLTGADLTFREFNALHSIRALPYVHKP